MRRPSLVVLAACALSAACSPAPLAPKGGSCHSLSDCQVGLVCLEARCTDDTSSIEGEAPNYELDAGALADAGPDAAALGDAAGEADAAVAQPDAALPTDAGGSTPVDAGRDAGVDAGSSPVDAGAPDAAVDAGQPPEPDAGAEVDAGEAGAG